MAGEPLTGSLLSLLPGSQTAQSLQEADLQLVVSNDSDMGSSQTFNSYKETQQTFPDRQTHLRPSELLLPPGTCQTGGEM